jgi:hypothetical protein
MSIDHNKNTSNQDGEIADSALDSVSGGQGQNVRPTETIVVTATRLVPKDKLAQKTADKNNTQVASTNTGKKPA